MEIVYALYVVFFFSGNAVGTDQLATYNLKGQCNLMKEKLKGTRQLFEVQDYVCVAVPKAKEE